MQLIRRHAALPVVAAMLSACYVVPVQGPGGTVVYETYPLPPAGTPLPARPAGQLPAVLNARLYPSNDMAAQTGILVGTVTNMMTGKGRFQLTYLGEVLVGEATRVSNDDRRGVASAYGPKGTFMSCEYQMTTPYQGTGDCTFSSGATYKVHMGTN